MLLLNIYLGNIKIGLVIIFIILILIKIIPHLLIKNQDENDFKIITNNN